MKRLIILFFAGMLAVPAISYAGSATSRWDLSIGGMVKVDYMYANQSLNQDVTEAERQASGLNSSSRDRYGATSWGIGESRLNFLIKGPDTWGARTSAFIEGDFRFDTSNSVSGPVRNNVEDYGLFALRHAFMKFEWPTFTVIAGQTWTVPGVLPCFCLLGVNENGAANKGALAPQLTGIWQATKTFSITGGIQAPYSLNSWPGGSQATGTTIDDGFQRSNLPLFFSEILYKTDACGKIGAWMLQFGLGGLWGREKPITPYTLGPYGDINGQASYSNTAFSGTGPGNSVQYWNVNGYDSSNVDEWMVTFKSFIPIIPEKAPGKLAHTLGLAVSAFTGQDIRQFAGGPPLKMMAYAYDRTAYQYPATAAGYAAYSNQLNPRADYVAPVATGGWAQLQWYWTNTLWSGFYYSQTKYNVSDARKAVTYGAGPTLAAAAAPATERLEEYHVNLIYDPNPAIRLGLEYSRYNTHYARQMYNIVTVNGYPSGLSSNGNVDTVRVSATYFF
ncbi:MAG TPA: hypothetical protein VMT71_09635 [Syntrophorhabdales bacterium]|nr:hypothetical protein [Syntrophorhabdales bacterium]